MPPIQELPPDALRRTCPPDRLEFETTADLEPPEGFLGQPRAVAAATFGLGIEREGYNLFALGAPGTGRRAFVKTFLEQRAAKRPVASDWCYVYNFDEPRRPRALSLAPGRAARLRKDMEEMVEEVRTVLAAAFESDEYQARRRMLDDELKERQTAAFEEVQRDAERRGLRVIQSPAGILIAPLRHGKVVPPQELETLGADERRRLEEAAEHLQGEMQKMLRQAPRWQREHREKVLQLNRQVTQFAAGALMEELRNRHREEPQVVEYLNAVEEDVVKHARAFVGPGDESTLHPLQMALAAADEDHPFLRRYRVNVIVDRTEAEGAPVVWEDHPTHANLNGRVEHLTQLGALLTDFNLIRAGALHRANGGYLVLDALELLRQPFAWDGLKRALRSRQINIESLGEALGLVHTVSLEPGPIPLSLKVVLIGEPLLYYLLCAHDPDFGDLFKVAADLDDRMQRSPDTERDYARLIGALARRDGLRPFDRGAVARSIERAARLVDDGERLTLNVSQLRDLLRESEHWASEGGRQTVEAEDVDRAVAQQEYRADRLRERLQDELQRGTLDVATEGSAVGQINGVSVIELGGFAFGRPSRITARVRLGAGEVVDIEREVKLAGPLHSKGVLILSGFLGERYAAETPLSLSASLVFEQSYGGVEGDSASLAELYALLSAIAGVAIRQTLGVTGSVNQHGRVQAVGGVNEKIEGFFDLCRARGLSGPQGVLIPASNRVHLMLRRDVVEAVEAGRFHVYPVGSVDDGLEILTGLPAGERAEDGSYPEGSFNRRVAERLAELASKRKAFGRPEAGEATS